MRKKSVEIQGETSLKTKKNKKSESAPKFQETKDSHGPALTPTFISEINLKVRKRCALDPFELANLQNELQQKISKQNMKYSPAAKGVILQSQLEDNKISKNSGKIMHEIPLIHIKMNTIAKVLLLSPGMLKTVGKVVMIGHGSIRNHSEKEDMNVQVVKEKLSVDF